ncbi:MAG: sigma-54 dependent transcriptional regulator [Halofilum sp. (in: g-proteobacteria)]|nr:sigma-54 dependent transcriptional regulator [Halofilum sp. (in: g-proteobacteria)]
MSGILVIDDEQVIRDALARLLERHGYTVTTAADFDAAVALSPDSFDFIIVDLKLPGGEGIDIIEHAPAVPVLVMTSYASVQSAVESMKRGAIDYIAKPFDHDELLLITERAMKERRLSRQNAALKQDLERDYPTGGMVGSGPAMEAVRERVQRVAPTDVTVLILGESGTGKELVARAIHDASPRAGGPLIAVNCAAIPEGLIESELFGHEKGAFTGAAGKRIGLVEAASSGTLFLDEIGELPLAAQAQLLRVLEDGEIRPVGASRARRVDIRLIAATHCNLDTMCGAGTFRQDLFYRLQKLVLQLKPLRERPEDLLELAHYMLEKAAHKTNRQPPELGEDAVAAIRRYHWPGNVRELENAIERAVILCDDGTIHAELLGLGDPPRSAGNGGGHGFELTLDEYFRAFVLAHQDRLTETELARRLGISRKSLWERRQRMDLARSLR